MNALFTLIDVLWQHLAARNTAIFDWLDLSVASNIVDSGSFLVTYEFRFRTHVRSTEELPG